MKKLLSILTIVTLLLTALVMPTSAAEPLNVMTKIVGDLTAVDGHTIYGAKIENSKRTPANMFDGKTEYDENTDETYCSFGLKTSQKDIVNGVAPKYNIMGETGKADSIYYAVAIFELDQIYTVDRYAFYGSQFDTPGLSMDGFDILVSTTGDEGSWTIVDSITEASCGQPGSKWEENAATNPLYKSNVKHSATFNPIEAKFVAFALTQPRCLHTEDLLKNTGTATNQYQHWFRIAELMVFESDKTAATNAPETTNTPETTTAPTQTPATADTTVLFAAILVMIAAVFAATRRTHKSH